MTSHTMLIAINNISDDYIMEYSAQDKGQIVTRNTRKICLILIPVAACLLLLYLYFSGYFSSSPFRHSGAEDPKASNPHTFSSYDELKKNLPENHFLSNLNSKSIQADSCVASVAATSAYRENDQSNWYYLNMNLSMVNDAGLPIKADLWCILNSEKSAEEIFNIQPLTYSGTREKLIYPDTEVFVSYNEEAGRAIFQIGKDVYRLSFYRTEKSSVYEFINTLFP